MSINLGIISLSKFYLGAFEVLKLYVGGLLVYNKIKGGLDFSDADNSQYISLL